MTGEPSRGERALKHILMRLRSDGVDLGYWEAEYQFHPTRKWRLDFAWPELWLGIEIQGSTWARGIPASNAVLPCMIRNVRR